MNTPAHLLLAAAVFARPAGGPRPPSGGATPRVQARRNGAALLGAVLPDLSLFLMVAWERRANGRSWEQIFGHDYRDPFWQAVFAVDNSIPLYAALLALALARGWGTPTALSGAALLHLATDLPLHHNDARAHFQPFSDWVFVSPVSYWDPERHGDLAGPLEGLLCVALAALLWRRFRSRPARALIATALALEAAPAFLFPLLTGPG